MANVFTNFLNNLSGDLANTNLKDFQHANRLYVQNFYRLAPKHGFLYFVRFILNPKVADDEAWRTSRQDLELGMLVKKCDLPKISLEGPTVNIYNKKQPVYTKVTYQPVNMSLHDDNAGLVRSFWQMYYQYYTADSYFGGSNTKPGTMPYHQTNRYLKPAAVNNQQLLARSNPNNPNYNDTTDPARYGLDSGPNQQMIRAIEIYQLSRKNFFLHTLVNPKIRTWNMDTLDQSSNKLMEHNISIEYEGVYFGKGKVTRYDPSGWTDLHYDLDPSPIGGLFGRSSGGLTGTAGLIQDGTQLFSDLQDLANNPQTDVRAGLQTILQGFRLASNAANLNPSVVKQEMQNATGAALGFTIGNAVGTGAVPGLSVPVTNTVNPVTVASQKTISPTAETTTGGSTPDSAPTAVGGN